MRKIFLLLSLVMGLSLMAPAPVFAKDDEEEEERGSKKGKEL